MNTKTKHGYFQVTLNLEQIRDLVRYASELSYYLKDEEKHYEESNLRDKENHIYNSVKKVEDITSDLLHQIY